MAILFTILSKKRNLHVLDKDLPKLTQSYFFMKYVYIKGARQTRQSIENVLKLIKRKKMALIKRKTEFCRLVG